MNRRSNQLNIMETLRQVPHAVAIMRGDKSNSQIKGNVKFYQTPQGVVIVAMIHGLPSPMGSCNNPVFAFHIHEGSSCSGTDSDNFSNVGMHYNPNRCLHPYHAGDMPPLFGANGIAYISFLSNRFTVNEIIGKTVIIHGMPDDFMSQPSGNAGNKIACGEIVKTRR